MRDSPERRWGEARVGESEIEQAFGGFGGESFAPGFRFDQVPDFAFFGAS
jgi:hypothetical protein